MKKAIATLLIGAVVLAGCGGEGAGSESGPIQPEDHKPAGLQVRVLWVDVDGSSIPCITFADAGVSCDWTNGWYR